MIRLKMAGDQAILIHNDLKKDLQHWAKQIDLKQLYGYLDQLIQRLSTHHISLNVQLQYEALLIQASRLTR